MTLIILIILGSLIISTFMHKRKNTKDINTVNYKIFIGSQSNLDCDRNYFRLGRLVQFQR
jgi:hypothetical protein